MCEEVGRGRCVRRWAGEGGQGKVCEEVGRGRCVRRWAGEGV